MSEQSLKLPGATDGSAGIRGLIVVVEANTEAIEVITKTLEKQGQINSANTALHAGSTRIQNALIQRIENAEREIRTLYWIIGSLVAISILTAFALKKVAGW